MLSSTSEKSQPQNSWNAEDFQIFQGFLTPSDTQYTLNIAKPTWIHVNYWRCQRHNAASKSTSPLLSTSAASKSAPARSWRGSNFTVEHITRCSKPGLLLQYSVCSCVRLVRQSSDTDISIHWSLHHSAIVANGCKDMQRASWYHLVPSRNEVHNCFEV